MNPGFSMCARIGYRQTKGRHGDSSGSRHEIRAIGISQTEGRATSRKYTVRIQLDPLISMSNHFHRTI